MFGVSLGATAAAAAAVAAAAAGPNSATHTQPKSFLPVGSSRVLLTIEKHC
jgi:hypothetical protein